MKPSIMPIGVQFVCTGNICRSPTAEAVFRHLAKKSGLLPAFNIGSAGTHGYHVGDPPDPRAIEIALERGVDMRSQRARRFETGDFSRYHYILAMDSGHHAHLMRERQGIVSAAVLDLFLKFPNKINKLMDVPDPYYSDRRAFEAVYDMVEGQCRGLLAFLQEHHGLK